MGAGGAAACPASCLFGPGLFGVAGVGAECPQVGVVVGAALCDGDPVVDFEGVVAAAGPLAELAHPVSFEDALACAAGEGLALAIPCGGSGGHALISCGE